MTGVSSAEDSTQRPRWIADVPPLRNTASRRVEDMCATHIGTDVTIFTRHPSRSVPAGVYLTAELRQISHDGNDTALWLLVHDQAEIEQFEHEHEDLIYLHPEPFDYGDRLVDDPSEDEEL